MQRNRSSNGRRTSRVEPEPVTGVRPITQPEETTPPAPPEEPVDYKQAYEIASTYLRRALRNLPRSERELIEADIASEPVIARTGGLPR